MGRCRVLHIIDSLDIGGTENRCLEIIAGVDGTKFDSHLVYFDGKGGLRSQLERLHVTHGEIKIGAFGSIPFWTGLKSLTQYIRDHRIQVIQTYGFYSNIPGIIAGRLSRTPGIVASRRDMGEFLRPMQQQIEQWLWRFADRVVVNATAIKDALIRGGVPAGKLVVIPNGVVCHPLPPSINNGQTLSPKIGMVANFRRQKDHITFLDAAALVLSQRPEARFVLVGGGPREHEVRSYTREQGLESHVDFLGTMTETEVSGVLKNLTVSVLSSHCNEGLPNVVLEAMAASKPVIATDVGGTREAVIDGFTGYLIPPRDPRALAEKILWMIDHPEASREMGLRGRRRVEEHFSLSRMKQAFADLYVDCLRQKGFMMVDRQ